jgi:hypothetical protein
MLQAEKKNKEEVVMKVTMYFLFLRWIANISFVLYPAGFVGLISIPSPKNNS